MGLLERAHTILKDDGLAGLMRSIPPFALYKSGQYAHYLPPVIRQRLYGVKPAVVLKEYWRTRSSGGDLPFDRANRLNSYFDGHARSQLLVDIVSSLATRDAGVLELGCGVGRNLSYLHEEGYHDLTGLDINPEALAALKAEFPALAADSDLYAGAIDEVVPALETDQFDIVFTMAVLGHLHPQSEWVFDEIARITENWLITIEDERTYHWRHTPRNYADVFTSRGFEQVETIPSDAFPPAVSLHPGFVIRVFTQGKEGASLRSA